MTLFLGMCVFSSAWGQKHWVFFKDKGPEQTYYEQHPEGLLSARTLEKRMRKGIPIDETDYPVSKTYLDQLRNAGLYPEKASKWLNAVSVDTDLDLAGLQEMCENVVSVRPVGTFILSRAAEEATPPPPVQGTSTNAFTYGQSEFQVTQLNTDCMHDKGFTGDGVLVAVFDAGFRNMDTIAAFDSLWANNRVLQYWDFVNGDTTVFDENAHGMQVASCFAAFDDGTYVGTAPGVSLLLARTETVFEEVHQEEDNWLAAVEWADSLGADMIQSSLGYSTFDAGEGDYTYNDLDGNTAIITNAADLAADKGILVVSSAGNEGNGSWHYITAPCDADSILCVGAVNFFDERAGFSSVGPTADDRIKPDVMALGAGVTVIGTAGNVTFSSGTSFSAPLVCGMVACLIEAHPLRTNMEVIDAVRKSGDRAAVPDTAYGWGIPDACVADSILSVLDSLAMATAEPVSPEGYFNIYPNPVESELIVEQSNQKEIVTRMVMHSLSGQEIMRADLAGGNTGTQRIATGHLADGMYILQLETRSGKRFVHRFLKQ